MDKYSVTGEIVVKFPFTKDVEAEGPVDAEQAAVKEAKEDVLKAFGLMTNERPVNVSVKWIPEE